MRSLADSYRAEHPNCLVAAGAEGVAVDAGPLLADAQVGLERAAYAEEQDPPGAEADRDLERADGGRRADRTDDAGQLAAGQLERGGLGLDRELADRAESGRPDRVDKPIGAVAAE